MRSPPEDPRWVGVDLGEQLGDRLGRTKSIRTDGTSGCGPADRAPMFSWLAYIGAERRANASSPNLHGERPRAVDIPRSSSTWELCRPQFGLCRESPGARARRPTSALGKLRCRAPWCHEAIREWHPGRVRRIPRRAPHGIPAQSAGEPACSASCCGLSVDRRRGGACLHKHGRATYSLRQLAPAGAAPCSRICLL